MSVKKILGLEDLDISELEIVGKIREAQRSNLGEVDFVKPDGSVVKIFLPNN